MYIGKNDGECPISHEKPLDFENEDRLYDEEQLRLTLQDQEAVSKILVDNIHATKDLVDELVEYVRKARRGLV